MTYPFQVVCLLVWVKAQVHLIIDEECPCDSMHRWVLLALRYSLQ